MIGLAQEAENYMVAVSFVIIAEADFGICAVQKKIHDVSKCWGISKQGLGGRT